ncbi:hypothetical protein QQ045_019928 [Rhodiola kirilowii]
MTDNRIPKRCKSISITQWLRSDAPSSVNKRIEDEVISDTTSLDKRIEDEAISDTTSLERDPGKRQSIGKYPLNERDYVRRAYVLLGPNQPHLKCYPTTYGVNGRRFNKDWFLEWPWLEYSIAEDKAYCFPCFLFDSYPSRHPQFTQNGFYGWKNMMCKSSGIVSHVGGINSIHSSSMCKWENLRNPSKHIERVMSTLSSQEVTDKRLRLNVTILVVKVLARQGCSFRGNDESVDSLNSGNFDAILDLLKVNEDYRKVLDSGPKNATYRSPRIQKQIANILGNKVRAKIREEVGDSKFCILVDEALDVANKEQMAIILRFVDSKGLIRERFFKVINVVDTCSLTLKDQICRVLAEYDLKVEDIRGQGYDGASNMRGQFNGLQALFLKECPYAYYVHCFAHRLQLLLNAAAKGVPDVWQFFSTLVTIVNFVDSSAKRHGMLKAYREAEILELVAAGSLGTGSATRTTVDDLYENGLDKVKGEAKGIGEALIKFEFVYGLLLMHEVMNITEFLSQAFQKKDIDIVNAVECISLTKEKLQALRYNGWHDLITKVAAFSCEHDIIMPDMSLPYKRGARRNEMNITNEHYFWVNVFYAVIDSQMAELDNKFTESSIEILVLSASFHPRNNFQAFKVEDVLLLASKFYPSDFSEHDMVALNIECGFFALSIPRDPRFANLKSISDVCRLLVEHGKSTFYPMIYRLVCLILTLPVSIATTERAFSSMNIIKSTLRNKMNDEFLDDLMVLYVERTFADYISNDDVIAEFEMSGVHRVKFS